MKADKTSRELSDKKEFESEDANISMHSESSVLSSRQHESARVLFSSAAMLIYSNNLLPSWSNTTANHYIYYLE